MKGPWYRCSVIDCPGVSDACGGWCDRHVVRKTRKVCVRVMATFANGDSVGFYVATTTKVSKVLGIAKSENPRHRIYSVQTDATKVDVDIADFRIKKLENPSHPYQGTLP